MKISATIITLNEERNIVRAIESLRCCDEIMVVDSGSIDRTGKLAKNLGARMAQISLAWGCQDRRISRPEQAANDWILSMDADESLSEALEGEIWQPEEEWSAVRRLYDAPAWPRYLGKLDPALRLVSGPQDSPVQPQGSRGSATTCTSPCKWTGASAT